MWYRLLDGQITDINMTLSYQPIANENIEQLLEVGDIGINANGHVFEFRDPGYKQEFLRMVVRVLSKRDNGDYTIFACKNEDKKWVPCISFRS